MRAGIYFGSTCEVRDDLISITNPYTHKVVSEYPTCSADDAKKALKIAQNASEATKKTTMASRLDWLNDVATKLEIMKEEMAQTITDEVGKPIYFSRIEVERAVETIKLTAHALVGLHGETINTDATKSGKRTTAFFKRVPVGVVGAITPFNFPLNLVVHKLAPALAAGNAIVLKPTPEAPLTAYKLVKLFIESPFAIKDAISLVYGDAEVGNTMVSSDIPRVLSFTGSVGVGAIITRNAGIKKLALELGGNAATFIEKSADLSWAAKRCAYGAFYNSGQVCISLQRIYVQSEVYEAFAHELQREVDKLVVGDPYADDTFVGPLINTENTERALSWVQSAIDEGAVALTGNRAEGNLFYPTVMANVTDTMKIVCEEVFAPIVSLVKVETYEEAMEKINNSPYGLQFSIFTNNLDLSMRFIDDADAGGVVINDIPTLRFDIQPYGGVKLSGIGKEGPKYALEEFTEIKSVVICNG